MVVGGRVSDTMSGCLGSGGSGGSLPEEAGGLAVRPHHGRGRRGTTHPRVQSSLVSFQFVCCCFMYHSFVMCFYSVLFVCVCGLFSIDL